jgi:hypothetical protein
MLLFIELCVFNLNYGTASACPKATRREYDLTSLMFTVLKNKHEIKLVLCTGRQLAQKEICTAENENFKSRAL